MVKDQYIDSALTYQSIRTAPYTRFFEEPSVINVLGRLEGLNVLDLACGTGHYTRILKTLGAQRVVGIDLSSSMILEAKACETNNPLGIEYSQADARFLSLNESFDIVTAFYLLNYAETTSDLNAMINTLVRHVRQGGRVVTIVPNPDFRPDQNDTKTYGFKIEGLETRADGQRVKMTFLGDTPLELEFMQWGLRVLEELFRQQGLEQLRWTPFEVTTEGLNTLGASFWYSALNNHKSLLLTAVRGF